jgi:predicted acyltransferase
MAETSTSSTAAARIVSMDQFRGYTVAGMFAVNFLTGLKAIPAVMAHHNSYFSYADSIMPSFIFAVGFSYRLTLLRRLPRIGAVRTYLAYARRSLALVLLSLVIYGFGSGFSDWQATGSDATRQFVAELLKANLWEVLAIIGVTQVFIMPVVAASTRVRMAALGGCVVAHGMLSYWFNFDFVYGLPNWMDAWWGAAGKRAWDGGFFGIIAWAVAMLAGTLAYDVISHNLPVRAARIMLVWGALFMVVGYALSCLTRLYDVPRGTSVAGRVAESPVWPPWQRMKGKSLAALLAEPPFVAPPPPSERQENYWMMGKRVVSASFILFASGFAFALYALFVVACDVGGLSVGLFRTFGQNPLAAYIIHHLADSAIRPLVPDNAPLWYCLVGFAVFFGTTYLFVRQLEKQGIYVRM